MKKIALTTILVVAAGWLSGCAVCYEEYGDYPCESRIIVAPAARSSGRSRSGSTAPAATALSATLLASPTTPLALIQPGS